MIEITESRPISKTKNWVVTRLVEKAAAGLIARRCTANAKTAHNVGRFSFSGALHMIKVGDTLPAATLQEYSEVEGDGCSIGPNPVDVAKATAGKTIALFALPGAFTPTCSAKHVPGYVRALRRLQGRRRGRDLVRERQRRLRDGRLGARPEDRRQGAHAGRRQRRFRQGHRPDAGPDRPRHGRAQQPLFDAGEGRQGRVAQRRGAGQVRSQRRRHAAGPGQAAERADATDRP